MDHSGHVHAIECRANAFLQVCCVCISRSQCSDVDKNANPMARQVPVMGGEKELPPSLLLIVREHVMPGHETEYARLETALTTEGLRRRCPHPHMALESTSGPKVVWWLNAFASPDAMRAVEHAYASDTTLKAALDVLARQKAVIVSETETVLAEYDATASAPVSWNMLATRYFVVRSDAPALDQAAAFVAPDGRSFAFRPAQSRADADRMAATEREAIVLAVEPRWSLPAADWIEADPTFWNEWVTRDA